MIFDLAEKYDQKEKVTVVTGDIVTLKPLLSRVKCVCLQKINIRAHYVENIFQKIVLTHLKYCPKYVIIQVRYNSRKKTNNKPDNNAQIDYSCRVVLARMRGVRARIFGITNNDKRIKMSGIQPVDLYALFY